MPGNEAVAVSSPPKLKLRWWVRLLRSTAVVVVALYAAIAVLIGVFQDRLVFPGHDYQGKPWAIVRESSAFELLHLHTADNTPITAIFGNALDANDRPIADSSTGPTVVFFYGNGSAVANSFAEFRMFRRLGCNVIIPDFVGYGMSAGLPSEGGCYATADAAYDYVLHRPGIDTNRIVISGWSLGAAVAIDLASRKPAAGLITFSAFTTLIDMGRVLYPWLPTSLFMRSHFLSEQKIAAVTAPMLLVHGTADTLIPFAMRDQLAAAARQAGRSVETAAVNSDHVNIFELGGDPLHARIGEFLKAHVLHLQPATRP